MSELLHFPQSARHIPAPSLSPGGGCSAPTAPGGAQAGVARPARDVGLGHIARRLGRPTTESVPTTIALIRELIRRKGFPPPLGFRRWRGELLQGWQAVCVKSRWPVPAVDAWFDNAFPQHAEAQAGADEREWAGKLDEAATRLGEVA